MSRFSQTLILLLVICLAILVAGCTEKQNSATAPGAASSSTAVSGTMQASGNWMSTPPAGSSGEALLAGAKELMKGIYTYSPGAPDYLPASYSGENVNQTGYVKHAVVVTSVVWPASDKEQVEWSSVPGTSPKGWSGITMTSGLVSIREKPHAVQVQTDCSGFITSLFAYANTVYPTKFTSWKTESPVPEAGCYDPQGKCIEPNTLNYYNLFVTGQNGWFQSVSLPDLQPGDIIAYANSKDKSDSGHIMLVAAVSAGDSTNSRNVVIIDETVNVHSADTRNIRTLPSGTIEGAGVGMGMVKLSTAADGTLQFSWGLNSPAPQPGPVALGRAL